MRKEIRVKLSKNGEWVTAQLLQITDGWLEVRVDDKDAPLWVMEERCHPQDLRELMHNQEKIKTGKFTAIKIDDDE